MSEPEDKDKPDHPTHPHGGPPGQTGEHPQGGPPGQDKPDKDEPEPSHPIVIGDDEDEEEDEPEPAHPITEPGEEPHPAHPVTPPPAPEQTSGG